MAGKPNVLLALSDPSERDAALVALARDFDVIPAASAKEALTTAQAREVDVVCADHKLPSMTGLELIRKIAALSRATGCILLAEFKDISKDDRKDDRITGLLFKPFQSEQLRELVGRVAKVTQMRRELKRVSEDLGQPRK